MADLEREARQKVAELEKRIKSLEERMNRQYDETENIRRRLDVLERGLKPATTN